MKDVMILSKDACSKYKINPSVMAKYCRNKNIIAKKKKVPVDSSFFLGGSMRNTASFRSVWVIDEKSLIEFLDSKKRKAN